VAGTELMPRLVGGDTEPEGSKLKRGKWFLKPNFELVPSPLQVRRGRREFLGKLS
jgi:hypothetical protein